MELKIKRYKDTKLYFVAFYDDTVKCWVPLDFRNFKKKSEAISYLDQIVYKLGQS